jgi:type IV secretory pathway VirB10-like protein
MQPADPPEPTSPARDALLDRRIRPHGALPRHLQTWLMIGLAVVMLVIILVTGHPSAPKRSDAPAAQPSSALNPERLRNYQEQLSQREMRLRQELAETQAAATASSPAQAKEPQPIDPMVEEQRRRAYSSLFADNVAHTKRASSTPPKNETDSAGLMLPSAPVAAPSVPGAPIATPATTTATTLPSPVAVTTPAPVPPGRKRLSEGTVIEAVLTNRLEGSFVGQVNALVTTPVYSWDRQTILIPAGARVLGSAAPVQALGQARLAVKFHRLLMPNGQSFTLDQFAGLNQRGDAGLIDQVNRHYLQLFGASMALGALSGLAQFSTRNPGSDGYSFGDAYGQGLGGSLAASSGRILDRFLNVLPSVTIREGHRLKIYLTSDLDLPPYDGSTP